MRFKRWGWHGALLSLPSLYYLWFALKDIASQGLYLDVALFGLPALCLYKPHFCPAAAFFNLGRISLPLMTNAYVGAWEAYFSLPWIYFFGNTALALNLSSVFLGFLSLPAIYWAGYRLTGKKSGAFISCALLASSTSYITASRIGLYLGVIMCFFALAALAAFLEYCQGSRPFWALIGLLFLGFGLGSRLQFSCYALSVGLAALLVKPEIAFERPLTGRFPIWAWMGALLIGFIPYLLGNVLNGFPTLNYLFTHAVVSRDGINNLDYWANLKVRASEFCRLANGTAFSDTRSGIGFALALPIACLIASLTVLRKKISRKVNALWLAAGIFLLLSPFTPNHFDVHHLLLLLILTYLAAAGTLAALVAERNFPSLRAAGGALFILAIFSQANIVIGQDAVHKLHGGYEVRWNLAGELTDWLREKHIDSIGLGDTGIMDPLRFLSGGSIHVREIFWAPYLDVPREKIISPLENRLNKEKIGYYVFRPKDSARAIFWPDFMRAVASAHKKAVIAKTISAPDGTPVYRVYEVR
ncbi:MAG: phospholipid carrier-dependent glycosyltransferase [Elusimicrobiota bacterium]